MCWACGIKGVLEHYARTRGLEGYDSKQGDNVAEEYILGPRDNRHLDPSRLDSDLGPFFPPEDALASYRGKVTKEFLKRGFAIETLKAWEIGNDNKYRRTIFPVRDVRGRLRGVSGRSNHEEVKPKYLHYSFHVPTLSFVPYIDYDNSSWKTEYERFRKSEVLYGEHRFRDHDSREILVVEGHPDVLRSWEAGFRVLGLMGSSFSGTQVETLEKLIGHGDVLVLGLDADEAGSRCCEELANQFKDVVPVYRMHFGPGEDPGDQTPGDLRKQVESAILCLD
jgi:DNA primase